MNFEIIDNVFQVAVFFAAALGDMVYWFYTVSYTHLYKSERKWTISFKSEVATITLPS